MKKRKQSSLLPALLLTAAAPWAASGQTNAIEQIADIYVHTALGTINAGASSKLGVDFDGGDGAVLMKWDATDTNLSSFTAANLQINNLKNDSDGSFTVHQMITDWDTNTDFGATFPVAGVDYVAAPLSVGGLNNGVNGNPHHLIGGPKEDTFSIGHVVKAWVDNPGLNKGIILVPRPQLNANYPPLGFGSSGGPYLPEIQLTSFRRVPGGLDTDDCRIISITNTNGTFHPTRLEAIEDAGISTFVNGDGMARQTAGMGVGDEAGNPKHSLLKFGLGELVVSNPTAGIVITNAALELHCALDASPVALNIHVHEMLVNWDEATMTWNQFGVSGPQPGVHYDGTELGAVVLGGGTGGVESAQIDITETANDWYQNPESNFGMICLVTDVVTSEVILVTSENELGYIGANDTVLIVEAGPVIQEPPVVTNLVADVAAVTFDAVTGIEYVLQSTSNIVVDAWADEPGSVIGEGGAKTLYDADTSGSDKVYRVRIED
jgi:hypothetical protein